MFGQDGYGRGDSNFWFEAMVVSARIGVDPVLVAEQLLEPTGRGSSSTIRRTAAIPPGRDVLTAKQRVLQPELFCVLVDES